MDIETLRKWITERDSYSTLETVDVHTGERTALKEFDYVIEAPNWTQDGKYLVYNNILNRAFPFMAKPGGGIGFDVGIYYITALLSILGSVQEMSGIVRTLNPVKQDYALEHFGELF
jgi:predicted dehydrogenase